MIRLMKDELGKQIKNFAGVRPKTYSYLKMMEVVIKKAKDRKKCITKRELKFEDNKNCLKIVLKY